jgi:hypothetical protein
LPRESNSEFTWYCRAAYVNVNNVKLLSVAKEMQKWVAFALMSGYKILRTADDMNILRSSGNAPNIFVQF